MGCAVARCLLAWGVRSMTLLDSSTVAYSNPVRQWLFELQDCVGGGKPKAQAAAEALRRIFPSVQVRSGWGEECKGEGKRGKPKAQAAAETLRRVSPSVQAQREWMGGV